MTPALRVLNDTFRRRMLPVFASARFFVQQARFSTDLLLLIFCVFSKEHSREAISGETIFKKR
jgi:hypothetical protein